jgi:hypothetical protein
MFRLTTPIAALSSAGLYLALQACGHTSAAGAGQAAQADAPRPAAPSAQAPVAPAAPAPQATPTKPNEPSDANAVAALGKDYIPALMTQHFLITRWARDSVIEGDVESLRKPMRALATYQYPADLPPSWTCSLTRLQEAARATAEAGTLDLAATGVAAMARVCGDCHLEHSGQPSLMKLSKEATPAGPDTLSQRMNRHMWALERMWLGLTGPSDAAWNAGASALAHAPVKLKKAGGELSANFRDSLNEVRALGARAREAKTSQERADVYGRTLATCAYCHAFGAEVEF